LCRRQNHKSLSHEYGFILQKKKRKIVNKVLIEIQKVKIFYCLFVNSPRAVGASFSSDSPFLNQFTLLHMIFNNFFQQTERVVKRKKPKKDRESTTMRFGN
jgi:hypothetical protein